MVVDGLLGPLICRRSQPQALVIHRRVRSELWLNRSSEAARALAGSWASLGWIEGGTIIPCPVVGAALKPSTTFWPISNIGRCRNIPGCDYLKVSTLTARRHP
jgi:hypothetical protein